MNLLCMFCISGRFIQNAAGRSKAILACCSRVTLGGRDLGDDSLRSTNTTNTCTDCTCTHATHQTNFVPLTWLCVHPVVSGGSFVYVYLQWNMSAKAPDWFSVMNCALVRLCQTVVIAGIMWYSGPFSLYRLSQCKETMRAVWWVDLMCDRAEHWVQSLQAWVGVPSLWSHAIFIAMKGKAWLGVGVDRLKVHGLTKQTRYGINLPALPVESPSRWAAEGIQLTGEFLTQHILEFMSDRWDLVGRKTFFHKVKVRAVIIVILIDLFSRGNHKSQVIIIACTSCQ